MSKLKDKLSANMRAVKANQQQAATAPAKAKDKPIAKPAAEKPVAAKTPARTSTAKPVSGEVPQSGTALFPARVWPD